MSHPLLFNLAALLSLVPAALIPLRRRAGRDGLFWAVLLLAVAGTALWSGVQLADRWQSGLSVTLWVSVAVSLILFLGIARAVDQAWRLAPLLLPYLLVVALFAVVFSAAPQRRLLGTAPAGWLELHIIVSVVTYGLLTMAAVAALAAFLQERALKAKRPTSWTRMLPSVTDGERLSTKLLAASEAVLAVGLASGMATLYFERGVLLALDHKTLLSLLAFVVIGGLLAAQRLTGMRGRLAARFVLLAYLLLTLAYPGVKFVTDVLLA